MSHRHLTLSRKRDSSSIRAPKNEDFPIQGSHVDRLQDAAKVTWLGLRNNAAPPKTNETTGRIGQIVSDSRDAPARLPAGCVASAGGLLEHQVKFRRIHG
jgi:hypothetical protein